ncbi:hypothetical protein [Tessaracoccus sp. G1721]
MALLVVLMGPSLVLTMVVVHDVADPERRIYGLAALCLMVACVTVTSCVNVLLLLVSSSPELFDESWRALFLPYRWPAPAFVLDNFVWDWFFGVSMLLAAPIFGGDPLQRVLRVVMGLSGALCLAGLAWLAVSPDQGIVIGILGWGVAGPLVFVLLANVFTRTRPQR